MSSLPEPSAVAVSCPSDALSPMLLLVSCRLAPFHDDAIAIEPVVGRDRARQPNHNPLHFSSCHRPGLVVFHFILTLILILHHTCVSRLVTSLCSFQSYHRPASSSFKVDARSLPPRHHERERVRSNERVFSEPISLHDSVQRKLTCPKDTRHCPKL